MTSNLGEVWVSNIRKKAGAAGVDNVINTRRGFGYYVEQALVVNSIQGKLTVYIIAGTMIVLVAIGLTIDAQLSRQLDNEFNRRLLAKAMTMVTLTEQDNGIVGKFAGQIEEKVLRFRNEVPPGVAVMTDKDKLKLILINIICNAITYSPGGSEIAIQATQIYSDVGLNVSNDTVDLDENDMSMMFERFWRKEQVRTGGNHAGLGLSLVKAPAELLNLKVKPMRDAGSRFTLSLSGLDHAV